MTTTVTELPIDAVYAIAQDRQNFDERAEAELAASIERHGLMQPITVRPDDQGRYIVIAGERRLRAHRRINATHIKAIVRLDLTAEQVSALQLVENVQRTDLDPLEEARAYRTRMDDLQMTVQQLAEWSGKPVRHIEERLGLLELNEEYQELLRLGDLNVNYAQRLALLDANRQRLAFKALVTGNGLSWRQFRKLTDELLAEQQAQSMFDLTLFERIEEVQKQARKGSYRDRDLVNAFRKGLPILRAVRSSLDDQPEAVEILTELIELGENVLEFKGDKVPAGGSADKLQRRAARGSKK